MAVCELIVFDWDGTLMDSTARIVDAVRSAIDAAGLEPRTDEQIREIIGLGMEEAVAALYPDAAAGGRSRLARVYREAFARAVTQHPAALYPRVAEVLDELEGAGYLLAIATGKSRSGLLRDLRRTGLERRFVASRTVDECASKPHPEMLQALLAEFGVAPGAAVMVGDTLFDLEMARQARVSAVAVSWGAHDPERLHAAGPDHMIDRIDQLPGWLARGAGRSTGTAQRGE